MKYSNRREVFRKGGKFAKRPSLEQQGYPVNKDAHKYVCMVCAYEWMPILTPTVCPECKHPIE